MTSISRVGVYPQIQMQNYQPQRQLSVREEFECQRKKNGLIERAYDSAKNITGLG